MNGKEWLREQAGKRLTETVIFDGGVSLTVQGMTGTERDAWEAAQLFKNGRRKGEVNAENLRAKLIVRCLINEDGSRMFEDNEVAMVGSQPAHVVNKLYEACQRLNNMRDEDLDELKKASGLVAGSDSPTN